MLNVICCWIINGVVFFRIVFRVKGRVNQKVNLSKKIHFPRFDEVNWPWLISLPNDNRICGQLFMNNFRWNIDQKLPWQCLKMRKILKELCYCINMTLLGSFNDFIISDFVKYNQISWLNCNNSRRSFLSFKQCKLSKAFSLVQLHH